MSEYSTVLLAEIEQYVKKLLTLKLDKRRYFHGLEHTEEVVGNAYKLARLEACPDSDVEILLSAAWFHDTGYIRGGKGHEKESVKIASQFLQLLGVSQMFVGSVQRLILSTMLPPKPVDLLEEIICDADLGHLGSSGYWRWELKLRQELELADNIHMADGRWANQNIDFFRNHHYFTIHAQALWDDQKKRNLRIMQNLRE